MQFIGGIDPAVDSPYPLSPITNFMNARGCTKTALRGSYHFNYIKAKKRWLEDLDAGYNDCTDVGRAISTALDNHNRYANHCCNKTYVAQWMYIDKRMTAYPNQVVKETKEVLQDLIQYLGLAYYDDNLVKRSQADNIRIALRENTKGKV